MDLKAEDGVHRQRTLPSIATWSSVILACSVSHVHLTAALSLFFFLFGGKEWGDIFSYLYTQFSSNFPHLPPLGMNAESSPIQSDHGPRGFLLQEGQMT